MLGTILFALVTFLIPTSAVFYAFFALLRVLLVAFHVAIAALCKFSHVFPIYNLFLYGFAPSRLPCAVYFLPLPSQSSAKTTALELKCKRPSFMTTVWLDDNLFGSILIQYFSTTALKDVLVGVPIKSLNLA